MDQEILKTDQVLVGDTGEYAVIKSLGLAGATARVYQVKRREDQRLFALKLMRPGLSPEIQKHFRDEMVNLQRLRAAEDRRGTAHIPRIIESSDLQQPKTQALLQTLGNPFIIMDFAEGIDIDTLLIERNTLNEADALDIARQFAEVLVVIHGERLTYTDMKLSNLFWNVEKGHLMVIDWNVIAENRLETDAPKDRLRAAGYLFQSVTGISICFNESGTGTADQKFRRWGKFKNLSEGTRAFLIKAFHPDLSSRHGGEGPQLQCTEEFLAELAAQAERYTLPPFELEEKGKNALEDRQWQEALFYLDLAARSLDIEARPEQFLQLRENLDKVRQEAGKLGRNAFFSGRGRYNNGLFADARADFEKAMRDDPYDEEARLFAILTHYAAEVGEEAYSGVKASLEECAGALLHGHLDLAGNALTRLPEDALAHPAVASLKAEIDIKSAVKMGQSLLDKDRLEEAQESFRAANQQRDRVLYVAPLEENIGNLLQLYRDVEELKKLYEEGDDYLNEERYYEAAWVFAKASTISQGSARANKKYRASARLDKIKKFLEKGLIEQAVVESQEATGWLGDEPVFMKLKNKIIDARCEQLRRAADDAYRNGDFAAADNYLREYLKEKPDDNAAKAKLEDIRKESSRGYVEKIQQLEAALRKDSSLEACEQGIIYIESQGYNRFEEGRQSLINIQSLKEDIVKLSEELDDAMKPGDLDKQLTVINQAITKGLKLRQGEPKELKKELQVRLRERDIARIREHLKYCRVKEALELSGNMLRIQPPPEEALNLQEAVMTANKLTGELDSLEKIRDKKLRFLPGDEGAGLVRLRLEKEHLLALERMIQIVPGLEAPGEVKDVEKKRENFLRDWSGYLERESRKANTYLADCDMASCKKISEKMESAIAISEEWPETGSYPAGSGNIGSDEINETLLEVQEPFLEKVPGRRRLRRWQTWNREFRLLVEWLEQQPVSLDWADNYHWMLVKLMEIAENPRVKETIAWLATVPLAEVETHPERLNDLAALADDSPLAFWLHEFFQRRLKICHIWYLIDENAAQAEEYIQRNVESSQRIVYENPLQISKEIENFFSHQEHLNNPSPLTLEILEETLVCAKKFHKGIRAIPALKEKEKDKKLQQYISLLQQRIHDQKMAVITELSEKLEQRLEGLMDVWENREKRSLYLEEARQEIEILRNLDAAAAYRLENRLHERKKELDDMYRQDAVKKHTTELEYLFEKILKTGENHEERLTLMNQGKTEIEKLMKISEEDAGRYERRLQELLEQMVNLSILTPSGEDMKPFHELQRRVCERCREEESKDVSRILKDFSRDTHFKDVIPIYIKWHENALFKLKTLPGTLNEKRIQALLELREQFGDFPQIDAALQETKQAIYREKNRETFNNIPEKFRWARREEEWQEVEKELERVDPAFLSEQDQQEYSGMKDEIEKRKLLREALKKNDLLQYLTGGQSEPTEKWLKALEWNIREKKGEVVLSPETMANINYCEIRTLEHRPLKAGTLRRLRHIRFLLQKIPGTATASKSTAQTGSKRVNTGRAKNYK